MAYPYYPTYQPYYPQNYQPQIQQPQQTNGILWVGSELEAQAYPVAPNNAVALWDSTKPAVYLKQADASGKPTMRVYMLAERTETAQIKQESQEGKITDYALKSDLTEIEAAIMALKKDMKAVKREMTKKEVEEDDE